MEATAILLFIVGTSLLILLGAWMLRINEVKNVQKKILQELKKQMRD